MKKHFLSVSMAMFIIVAANAQNFQAGISGGVDAARMALSGASGGPLKYKTDLVGGLFAEAGLSSNFGLQLEVNYSAQGAGVISETQPSSIGSFQLDYVTIPLLLKMYGTPRLSFYAGPQVGFLVTAKSKISTDETTDVKDQFKSTDFYAVFGSEYKFANGIFIGARYHVGLSNVAEASLGLSEIKNRYFSFRLGYAIKL